MITGDGEEAQEGTKHAHVMNVEHSEGTLSRVVVRMVFLGTELQRISSDHHAALAHREIAYNARLGVLDRCISVVEIFKASRPKPLQEVHQDPEYGSKGRKLLR